MYIYPRCLYTEHLPKYFLYNFSASRRTVLILLFTCAKFSFDSIVDRSTHIWGQIFMVKNDLILGTHCNVLCSRFILTRCGIVDYSLYSLWVVTPKPCQNLGSKWSESERIVDIVVGQVLGRVFAAVRSTNISTFFPIVHLSQPHVAKGRQSFIISFYSGVALYQKNSSDSVNRSTPVNCWQKSKSTAFCQSSWLCLMYGRILLNFRRIVVTLSSLKVIPAFSGSYGACHTIIHHCLHSDCSSSLINNYTADID